MDSILNTVNAVNKVLWDYILLFLLCGTGIYFTVRLKFIQVRKFGEGFRRLFGGLRLNGKKAGAEGMSSFQALTTAVAAQVGTGNIAGAATAIVSGGPGAIFWMWVSAFFGMATIFGEAVLAQKYKTTLDGEVTGGPIYYIRAAFRGRLGASWRYSSLSRSYWPSALWVTWCNPIPSALPWKAHSAFRLLPPASPLRL